MQELDGEQEPVHWMNDNQEQASSGMESKMRERVSHRLSPHFFSSGQFLVH
jgi:hypothetical protein